jgi:hypothetical protein
MGVCAVQLEAVRQFVQDLCNGVGVGSGHVPRTANSPKRPRRIAPASHSEQLARSLPAPPRMASSRLSQRGGGPRARHRREGLGHEWNGTSFRHSSHTVTFRAARAHELCLTVGLRPEERPARERGRQMTDRVKMRFRSGRSCQNSDIPFASKSVIRSAQLSSVHQYAASARNGYPLASKVNLRRLKYSLGEDHCGSSANHPLGISFQPVPQFYPEWQRVFRVGRFTE